MRRRVGLATVTCLALAAAACQLLVGVSDPQGVGPKPAPPDICIHKLVPAPSEGGTTDTSAGPGVLNFAGLNYRVKPANAPLPGFDLDGRCTGLDGSVSNELPCMKVEGTSDIDGDGGVDNALGAAAAILPFPGDFTGDSLSAAESVGQSTLIVQISNYNGTPNDNDVQVAVISTFHLECPCQGADGCTCDTLMAPPPPVHDGTDRWTYTGQILVNGLSPQSIGAYVADGVLVARPQTASLPVRIRGIDIPFQRPIVSGTIVPVGSSFRLVDTTIAGTLAAPQAISFVEHSLLPSGVLDGGLICRASAAALVPPGICNILDIRADLDAAGACDAVSFAFELDGEIAQLGAPLDPPSDPCTGATFQTSCTH